MPLVFQQVFYSSVERPPFLVSLVLALVVCTSGIHIALVMILDIAYESLSILEVFFLVHEVIANNTIYCIP